MPRRDKPVITITRMENAEIISVYTKEQAIGDEIVFQAGTCCGRGIVFTTHLIEGLTKEELLIALFKGLAAVGKFKGPDLATIEVNGKRVWVDYNGADITLMFPEDY